MQHLDEGTIHAWLDGALPPEEAASVESHVETCAECQARVAEARGLIAASSRILSALDNVPSGVVPARAPRRRHWYDRTDLRAAAAVLLVAAATLVVARSGRPKSETLSATASAARAAPMPSAMTDSVTPQAMDQSAPSVSESSNAAPQKPETPPVVAERRAEKKVATSDADRLQKNENAPSIAGAVGGIRRLDQVDAAAAVAQKAAPMALTAPPPMPVRSKDAEAARESGIATGAARAQAESNRIEGRVTDPRGAGIANATVSVEGLNLGAFTDKDGNFAIAKVPSGDQQLKVRRIGYVAQSIRVPVNEPVNVADVVMTPQSVTLSDIVVTGVAKDELDPQLEAIRTVPDTTQSIYRLNSGLKVTLTETLVSQNTLRDASADSASNVEQRKAARATSTTRIGALSATAAPAKPNNTISWTVGQHHYTLSGQLSVRELEAIKSRILKQKR